VGVDASESLATGLCDPRRHHVHDLVVASILFAPNVSGVEQVAHQDGDLIETFVRQVSA
jgi:hypothetical protein